MAKSENEIGNMTEKEVPGKLEYFMPADLAGGDSMNIMTAMDTATMPRAVTKSRHQ